ncbi:MAG TPA: cytochrome b5-like heme/steroid binding domain-containing protein, partial [Candidatus Paceibacterota bacterium]
LSLEEVARHGSRADCWSAINGSVYDLTSWIPQHPGGEQAILILCGTDGSATFNAQHGGAARQQAILAGFKVGDLGGGSATAGGAIAAPVVPAATGEVGEDSGQNRGRGRGGDD